MFLYFIWRNGWWGVRKMMNKKLLISQSIMWAAAILVVAIVEEKQFAISILVILATVSLMNLKKVN